MLGGISLARKQRLLTMGRGWLLMELAIAIVQLVTELLVLAGVVAGLMTRTHKRRPKKRRRKR